MIAALRSLRVIGAALIIGAFLLGVFAAWLWLSSSAAWQQHRQAAYVAGVLAHGALLNGVDPPKGITVRALSDADRVAANSGNFRALSAAPDAPLVTNIPISADTVNARPGRPITLVILSADLVYPIARLQLPDRHTAAQTLGSVARLLASYCSTPLVIARVGDRGWVALDGSDVWACDAAPRDLRLPAVLLGSVALAILVTLVLNLSGHFTGFAQQLRDRRRLGGRENYATPGPQELQDIVAEVNAYLQREREQIENRASVLSGVSHDLGTPATRLRLRTALIPDADLRERLDADIDAMTGMIESVLTYTRAEMNAETPRKLSLLSLLQSIVADYQDLGRAVELRQPDEVVLEGAPSVFMTRRGRGVVPGERQIIVTARPIALERAVCNLIENALKYGRRARVGLETDADTATVLVDDEGSDSSAKDMEDLMAPFRRGSNVASVAGHGLGLTIVATIASQHGGSLRFEDGPHGLRARLEIQRS